MPSIVVEPYSPALSDVGPSINGTEFRRPTSSTVATEPVRSSVTLASGGTRSYTKGIRYVYALAWARITEIERDQLLVACAPPVVTYVDLDGESHRVTTDEGVSLEAVPATFPILWSASVSLRDQDPTT